MAPAPQERSVRAPGTFVDDCTSTGDRFPEPLEGTEGVRGSELLRLLFVEGAQAEGHRAAEGGTRERQECDRGEFRVEDRLLAGSLGTGSAEAAVEAGEALLLFGEAAPQLGDGALTVGAFLIEAFSLRGALGRCRLRVRCKHGHLRAHVGGEGGEGLRAGGAEARGHAGNEE